jgi:signal recognition particle GTPase
MASARGVALLALLAVARGFAPPVAWRLPALTRAVRMNIFEKAVSGAASALGKGLNQVTGMPDLTEAEQTAMEKAMLDGTLNFDQFLIQMRVITKAGSIAAIAAKIPGAGDKIDPRAAEMATQKLKKYEVFCSHMTDEERADASLLLPGGFNAPVRTERIAKAAAVPLAEVQQFLGEFVVMRRTSQAMAQGKSPDEVQAAMVSAQDSLGMINRAERRLQAKQKKGKGKAGAKGFGA